MVAVKVNGQESRVDATRVLKLADLIELIKSDIDPEHMITSVNIDGRELSDGDWTGNVSQFQNTTIIEIETGRPMAYVASRMSSSPVVVSSCFSQFRAARKCFHDGQQQTGNQNLAKAVGTLHAFFEWYGSITNLVPAVEKERYNIDEHVKKISTICERICQQQVYQSWSALGETIQKQLEPELDLLEDTCRKFGGVE